MTKKKITLPAFSAEFSYALPERELLLATGGRAPRAEWLAKTAHQRILWCIDHGIDYCYSANLLPQRLIGDGDSANNACWDWAAKNQVKVDKFPPEKDYTDTQLALEMAAKENAFVVLTGAFGGRLDHAFSTAFTFAHSSLKGIMADENEALIFIKAGEGVCLNFEAAPKALSLLAFSQAARGVNIDNVKWPLNNKELQQGFPYSVSNEISKNPVHVSVADGILGIYLCWNFITC